MKYLYGLFVLALTSLCFGQSPMKGTVAYSREAIPGIPGKLASHLPTSYLIYVTVGKGTSVSATCLYIQGRAYSSSLKRVESPVQVARDVNVPTTQKDTLVKETPDDVYQVEVGDRASGECGSRARKLAKQNAVVVRVESGGSSWYGVAAKVVSLEPAAAP